VLLLLDPHPACSNTIPPTIEKNILINTRRLREMFVPITARPEIGSQKA